MITATAVIRKARAFPHPGPIRVYRDDTDISGTVLCPRHRSEFFTTYPGACSDGQHGQRCEICQPVSV